MNAMYEYVLAKRRAMEAQARALEAGMNIKPKYEYDSDEDTEGGTWEHKRRVLEMEATKGCFGVLYLVRLNFCVQFCEHFYTYFAFLEQSVCAISLLCCVVQIFMSPPISMGVGSIMFSGCPSVCAFVRACVRPSRSVCC